MLSRTMRSRATAALAASIFLLAPHAPAKGAEPAVGAFTGAFKDIVPQFESASGARRCHGDQGARDEDALRVMRLTPIDCAAVMLCSCAMTEAQFGD